MPTGIYIRHLVPLSERFWAKVNKEGPNGCWLWTASVMVKTKYGQIRVDGTTKLAHRAAYELAIGPIPEGLQVDHLCGNRLCVNPAHLEAVPQYVNNMRSDSSAAVNARKTHCIYGHEFNDRNTFVKKSGARECRTCAAERGRRRIRISNPSHRTTP